MQRARPSAPPQGSHDERSYPQGLLLQTHTVIGNSVRSARWQGQTFVLCLNARAQLRSCSALPSAPCAHLCVFMCRPRKTTVELSLDAM